MPNHSLTDAIKEAYASAPTNKVILDTLEFYQPGVQDRVYIVRSRTSVTAKDENGNTINFLPVGFQFAIPPQTPDGFTSLSLSVDNVGHQILNFINTAKSRRVPVEVRYRPYLSDDLSRPAMNPPLVLFLTDISVTQLTVSATATFLNLVNQKFPLELYIASRFPTLT